MLYFQCGRVAEVAAPPSPHPLPTRNTQFTMIEALQATLAHAGGGKSEFYCPNCKAAAGPLKPLDVSSAAETSGSHLIAFEQQMEATGIKSLLAKLKDEVLDGCVCVWANVCLCVVESDWGCSVEVDTAACLGRVCMRRSRACLLCTYLH
jgi:hypothetical protein